MQLIFIHFKFSQKLTRQIDSPGFYKTILTSRKLHRDFNLPPTMKERAF